MKIAIMQPYFFPYIGYFQLISAVDTFVLYDNIKYTKKGWINRNQWLQHGSDAVFTLPLQKASDLLDIGQRTVAEDFDRDKFLNKLRGNYAKAPCFDEIYALVENLLPGEDRNLFRILHQSIERLCRHLGIATNILISSAIDADHALRGEQRVIALCHACSAYTYVNAIGGLELYSLQTFRRASLDLRFIRSRPFEYLQFGSTYVPRLSILDVLMFNPVSRVRGYLQEFDLIEAPIHA